MSDQQQEANPHQSSEIGLLELGEALGHEKRLILGLPSVAGVMALIASFFLPPMFTARTSLVPPQQHSSSAAMAALSSLGGLAGLAGGGGISSGVDTLVSMIRSRSIKDMLIEQFDLMARYEVSHREAAYKELEKRVVVLADKKSNVISIDVDDEDPQFAADLANAYYVSLKKLMTRVAFTEAQQRRLYFEGQFQKAKDDLSEAETKLKNVSEKTGLVELKAQAEVSIQAVAKIRAEIAQREVKLSAMRTFATRENSDYQRVLAELNGLRSELAKMERSDTRSEVGVISAGSLPAQGLTYIRAFREMKYQEAVYEIMAKQFELAKADEAKEGGNVQQLDVAIPPERKSKPKRGVLVVLTVVASFLLGVLIASLKVWFRNVRHDENSQQRWARVAQAWQFKRR